ncbi:MAG TPA: 30S ribosomal protein S7, partial [Candidatus Marinimicrobia bacterium]|nr:30S ribosomal protein S7 [Candidatus Neomarinimicrobiota bacterium]
MRRRRPERRQILPDPVYNDLSVAKFINYLIKGGKKGVAEKIFYSAMD